MLQVYINSFIFFAILIINPLWSTSVVQEIDDLNNRIHLMRLGKVQDHKIITTLASQSLDIITGISHGIDLDRNADKYERRAARQSIMHRVISEYEPKKIFKLHSVVGLHDQHYVEHISYIALYHMALISVLNKPESFLISQDEFIYALMKERHSLLDQVILHDQWLNTASRTTVSSYSQDIIKNILGKGFMRRYLNSSRDYMDVEDQWLIQVRDIQDKRKNAGYAEIWVDKRDDHIIDQAIIYNNERNIAASYIDDNHMDILRRIPSHREHRGQHYISYKDYIDYFTLNRLPEEILCHIFEFADQQDWLTSRVVSQRFQRLAYEVVKKNLGPRYILEKRNSL